MAELQQSMNLSSIMGRCIVTLNKFNKIGYLGFRSDPSIRQCTVISANISIEWEDARDEDNDDINSQS